jgi:branched-chain amino acid transport system substrate-binding protein
MAGGSRWWLGLVATVCLAGCRGKPAPETVLIGHAAPRTGPERARGLHAWQGIQLAVEEANRDDVQGPVPRRLVVVQADTQGDRDPGPTAVRLITLNKVSAILGGTDPAAMEALAAVAQSSEVPLVGAAGRPGRPANDFVFQLGIRPAHLGRALARFALGPLKAKRAVVLADAGEGSDAVGSALTGAWAAAFANQFREGGGTMAGEWTFTTNSELKELGERLRSSKAGAVLVAGSPADVRELRKVMLTEKMAVLFASVEGSRGTLLTDPAGEGVYLVTAFVADAETPAAQQFVHTYRERFQEDPDVYAALAHDCATFLSGAIHEAKGIDGQKLQEALAGLETFVSLTGTVALDKDHGASRAMFIVRLENGQARTLRRYEAEEK